MTTTSIDKNATENVRLPNGWPKATRVGVLQVLSLAKFAMAHTRSFAANSPIERVRLTTENERLRQELALLREEVRIKDARMSRIAPAKRPHYSPAERMAILALRAARNWSTSQTAVAFLITAETISSWTMRVADEGSEAFLKLREPVNKFPDFVREIVRQLKTLCPFLGKVKIAEKLSRAGLHLGVTTVGRMLKENNEPMGVTSAPTEIAATHSATTSDGDTNTKANRKIVSRYANHIWLIDLTCVPIF